MTVGDKIVKRRKELHLSQEELATQLYMSRPTLSDIETGKRDVQSEQLKNIAKVLNTTVSFLIGETDSSNGMDPKQTKEALYILMSMNPEVRAVAIGQLKELKKLSR